jgi:membrane protein required for colicin V production
MPIEVLDVVVIVVVLISAVLAMVRGFVREILSIASWAAAAVAAYLLYKPLLPLVQPYFSSEPVATIVAAAGIFFVALIVASYITMKISDWVIDSRVGAIDRVLGFLFGAARGVLLLVVAFHFFEALVPEKQRPTWVTAARTKGVLEVLDAKLTAVLPKDLEGFLSKKPAVEEDTPPDAPSGEPAQTPAPAPDAASTGTEPDPKYNDDALKRMIETNGGTPAPAPAQ